MAQFLMRPLNLNLEEMLEDRKSGLIKQYLLSGVSLYTFFLSRLLFDFTKLAFNYILLYFCLIELCDVDLGEAWAALLLTALGSCMYSYWMYSITANWKQ